MKTFLIAVINGYKRYISPFLPRSCRFHPSCSTYFMEAVDRYGVSRGAWLFVRRIIKCHPFHPGGYDPLKGLDETSLKKIKVR